VQKYPHYNFVNLDILDSCASVNNVKLIERFKNYTFVQGSIGNMDLVIVK
jgi:dTDP-D-glucose 4,6-dehydratase